MTRAVVAILVAAMIAGSAATSHGQTAASCLDTRAPTLQMSMDPAPAAVSSQLAVLRRPQKPSDRLPKVERRAHLPVAGVNPDAIRMASRVGRMRIYLVPAENVHY